MKRFMKTPCSTSRDHRKRRGGKCPRLPEASSTSGSPCFQRSHNQLLQPLCQILVQRQLLMGNPNSKNNQQASRKHSCQARNRSPLLQTTSTLLNSSSLLKTARKMQPQPQSLPRSNQRSIRVKLTLSSERRRSLRTV